MVGMRRERPRTFSARAEPLAEPAMVRLAVVEEVADAVDRVLEERCDEENDDARAGRDERDGAERCDNARRFSDVGENQ